MSVTVKAKIQPQGKKVETYTKKFENMQAAFAWVVMEELFLPHREPPVTVHKLEMVDEDLKVTRKRKPVTTTSTPLEKAFGTLLK